MDRAGGKLHLNVVRVLSEECNKEIYDMAEDFDCTLFFF